MPCRDHITKTFIRISQKYTQANYITITTFKIITFDLPGGDGKLASDW
jgi:hypothetical protein